MEVENKVKKPSLPRNYVSLAQLQQRWTEEQQRKKREEEQRKQKEAEEEERRWRLEEEAERRRREKEAEEEDRKRREKEEAERSRLGQDNQIGRIRNGQRREKNVPKVYRDRKPPINRRDQSVKSFRSIGIDESEPEKSGIGVISIDEGEGKFEGVDEKKKKKKWNKRKPRANKELPAIAELISPEKKKVDEQLPAELGKRDDGNQSAESFRTIVAGERSSEESLIGAISVDAVNEKKKKKKTRRRTWNKEKRRAAKEQPELISPEHEKVDELVPAALAKLDNGSEANENEFHRNGRTAATDAGLKEKVPVKNWVRKEKSKAEENITRSRRLKKTFPLVLPENKKKAEEENIPVGVAEQEAEMGTNIEGQRKGKLLEVVNNNGPRKEKEVDPSSKIEGKPVDLSLNGETRGFKTNANAPNRHGYKKKSNGGYGKLSSRRAPNSRDSNLVWVKKD